ncbi:MAG: tetratricopeptide repeat protein [Flavobacteriales bacterium]|nr:tetratricopeptide repeat protein [Flavobacteriales bacterium]
MRPMLLLLLILPTLLWAQADRKSAAVRKQLDRGSPYPAIRKCDQLLKERPRDALLLCYRAEARNMIGDFKNAAFDASMAYRSDPDVPGLMLVWGMALKGGGHLDSARVLLEQAEAGSERDTQLAMLHSLLGNCDRALELFDALLEKEERSLLLRERAVCRIQKGDTVGGWSDLDRCIELDPRDPAAWNSRGLLRFAAQGSHQTALEDYRQALKLNPNYSFAINNRGASRMALGDLNKARQDFALAGRKNPNNPYVDFNKGLLAIKEGSEDAACVHFREAMRKGGVPQSADRFQQLWEAHCSSRSAPEKELGVPPVRPGEKEQNKTRRTNAPGGSNAP